MNYPEFKYVNVAVGGVFNRKGIYDIAKLGNPSGKKETYCTYFRYNNDMAVHFNKKGTVKGYNGNAWSDWLPIDIDSDDLEEAQMYLQHLVANLDNYNIDSNACRFYFSGSKGFHVMIPSAYFQAEPSADIKERFKDVALTLAEGIKIDTGIYDKTRLFRLPNTINDKSGLHKVELYPFEAMSMEIKDIQHRALLPVERLEIEKDIDASEELTKIYHEGRERKPESNGGNNKVKTKICMSKMMTGVGEGQRDEVGIRVASHLTQSGLTPKMMFVALDEWNETNDPPLDDEELSRIFRQGLEGYSYGCHDQFLKANCSPECLFYKKEWQRF